MGKLLIVSHDHTTFADRRQAAECLSELLHAYRGGDTIVIGIPRGGVVLADRIAERLGADMDIAVCHKIRADNHDRLIVGAVSEDGHAVLLNETLAWLQPSRTALEQQIFLAGVQMRIQRDRYRSIRPSAPLKDRTVILVDDGVATGATLGAALKRIQQASPSKVIVAVPLGPADSVGDVSEICDELLCFTVPADFEYIAHYYEAFPEVEDDTVLKLLKRHFDRDLLGEGPETGRR